MIQPSPVNEVQTRAAPATPSLRRALGRWDLTAIAVNQVIGGAVFAIPASVAALSGRWSPILIIAVGLASLTIAATFAEVSSRFDATGGPYLYTRAAFGRFAAFEVGWLLWFSRVASWASVINILVASLGFYWPTVTAGPARGALLTALIATLAIINVLGIRQSALVVNALTIGKLLPLAIFILVGLPAIDLSQLRPDTTLSMSQISASAVLLIFAFGGYEVVSVVAGEARDPRRGIPFALIMAIVIAAIVLTLAQLVSMSTVPDLASSKTPLADAATSLMGAGGAALITFGALISTTGNNMGGALSGSRNLFALAEQGDLPRFFGRVHPRFRTPVNAILITSAVSLTLALSGTFVSMAAASAISRLVVYVATCAAALRLRGAAFSTAVAAPLVVQPFGPVIPATALTIAIAIIAGASAAQLIGGATTLLVGAVLFVIAARAARIV
jgi:APA family basic amino acid/polyamine antiporter